MVAGAAAPPASAIALGSRGTWCGSDTNQFSFILKPEKNEKQKPMLKTLAETIANMNSLYTVQ